MLTVELPALQLLEAAEDEVEVYVWWAQVAEKKALAGEKLIREQCNHCHCKFLEVDDERLADLRNWAKPEM